MRELCEKVFKDYEFGLGLVYKQSGQKSFVLSAETIADPDRFLSELVVGSYRKK